MSSNQDPESIQTIAVLRNKLHRSDIEIAKNAAQELAKIHSDAAVSVLAETLQFKSTEVTSVAIEALWKIGNDAAIAVLAQALEHQAFWVRWGSAYALGTLGGEVAEKALVQGLNRIKHRTSIIEGLASIEPQKPALKGDSLGVALVAIIKSKSSLRERALDALGSVGHDAAVSALEEVVIRCHTPRLLSSATEALARIGTTSAINALTRLLQNKNWNVREYVVIALGACANREEAAAALAQALEDEDDDIRKYAIRELRRMGHESAIAVLAQTVNHSDPNTAVNAIWALSTIDNPVVISAISQALNHDDLYVREKADSLLKQIREEVERSRQV